MRFVVGGERFEFTRQQVERAMRGEHAEPVQKHVVEMLGTVFPPKQVFAQISGRNRNTFTTQEAQRVLMKLGFVCREAGFAGNGSRAWTTVNPDPATSSVPEDRMCAIEGSLVTAQLAIAELQRRVAALEPR